MQDTYTIKLSQITKALEDGQTITAIINGEYYDIEQDAPKLRTLAELTPEELHDRLIFALEDANE